MQLNDLEKIGLSSKQVTLTDIFELFLCTDDVCRVPIFTVAFFNHKNRYITCSLELLLEYWDQPSLFEELLTPEVEEVCFIGRIRKNLRQVSSSTCKIVHCIIVVLV